MIWRAFSVKIVYCIWCSAVKMAEASWKDKMTERWKRRSQNTLKEELTLNRFVIPRSITEVMKEDIYYPTNIEIEAPPVNQSNEEKKCQHSQLKCLNKDVYNTFYKDYIDFKNYINDILKNNFKLPGNSFTEKAEELQQKSYDNTINELNDKIQSLTKENDIIKQENKTFLKITELMRRETNKEELSVQQQNKQIPRKAIKKQQTIRKFVKLMKLIHLH